SCPRDLFLAGMSPVLSNGRLAMAAARPLAHGGSAWSRPVPGRSSPRSQPASWPRSPMMCAMRRRPRFPPRGWPHCGRWRWLLGKRMLVTGATGGVGRIAIQLGRASGADVTGLVRDSAASGELLRRIGAARVAEQLDGDFEFILDSVGGATFGLAIEHLAPRGVLGNIGTHSDDEAVTFTARRFDRAFGAAIYTLNLPDELASHSSTANDLIRLCGLVADGRLDGQVELEGSWREPGHAIDGLLRRRIG